jgi:glycosyltransferase involved in cell wall biosynthesis
MRAWKLLNQENKEAKLTIAGPGDQAEYLAYASELDVSESISFIGPQTDLINLYQGAEAVVLSSRYEGFPMVLVEALASGTPVVSYDCPSGPAEVVQNEENGYLVPLNDETALAAALQKIFTNEWNTEKMRASVMRFHSNHVAKAYTDVIEKL